MHQAINPCLHDTAPQRTTRAPVFLFPSVLTLTIVAMLAADAQSPTPYAEATALLEQMVREQKIAGAVAAVARGGKVEYLKAVGVQNLESGAPMTERTLFRIYSMTKPVTAVAAMMLIERGRARLDDPVTKYLPEFKQARVALPDGSSRPPSRDITVEDLLLHTSGLSHRTSDLYRRLQVRSRAQPLPVFIENIVRAPLMEDPGTRFRYSEATTVVGRLVEIWSGQPLDVFFEERIFKPLKMTDTTFWVRPEDATRLATVYGPSPSGGLSPVQIEAVPFTQRPALLEGAVGLVSTVPDFYRFSQMLLNRGELDGVRVLEAATVDRMTRNGLSDAVQKLRGGTMGWGLANVNVVIDSSAPNDGEYGWDGTAGTIFWIDPRRQLVAILMTQSSPPNPDRIRQRFKSIVDRVAAAP
jgi:CubicO group peptidase (beta-lactamase class C family)